MSKYSSGQIQLLRQHLAQKCSDSGDIIDIGRAMNAATLEAAFGEVTDDNWDDLVEALMMDEADYNQDGIFTVEEVTHYFACL